MKMYWGKDIAHIAQRILISLLDGGEWSDSRSGCFIPVDGATGTHLLMFKRNKNVDQYALMTEIKHVKASSYG